MFPIKYNIALRLSSYRTITQILPRNSTSAASETVYEKDPAPYFFRKEVQQLLRKVTRPNPDIVFRRRLDSQKLEAPEYKFMTDEQLKEAIKKADKKMWNLLQMPPIVKIRKEDDRILSKDSALQGLESSKHVFTDITFGESNKNRVIAVRESDGTLRLATWEEKDRLNQIYFPMKGREVYKPKMFEQEYLEPILERGDYNFILNRACIQFDPDNPDFHKVTQITYDHVDEGMHYEKLRSTRHYGPMVFYLAWNKKIDNLLFENITKEKIEDAVLAIKLYYILHPSKNAIKDNDDIKLINHFINTESNNKQKLDHIFKTYCELENERRKVQENIEKAHRVPKNSDEEINN